MESKNKQIYIANLNRITDTEKKLVVPVERQKGEGQDSGLGLRDKTSMYKLDKQQGYIFQHRKLELLFCNNF